MPEVSDSSSHSIFDPNSIETIPDFLTQFFRYADCLVLRIQAYRGTPTRNALDISVASNIANPFFHTKNSESSAGRFIVESLPIIFDNSTNH